MTTNQDLAAETGVKLDFYLVALTFTVLAFGVETGRFTGAKLPDSLEAVSWVLLLISGLAGLSRLEYIPVLYRAQHHLQTAQSADADIEKAFRKIERDNRRKYRIQRWAFSAGMVALVVARVTGQYVDRY